VDGRELVRLMIDYGVGTATVETYTIRRIDDDYFEGETIA
jgi:restriction system protein